MFKKKIILFLFFFSFFSLYSKETIVCIHGFYGAPWNMYLIEKNFKKHGYKVINWEYPSTEKSIEDHGIDLVDKLNKMAKENPGKEIHFVTHSMGGLVLRSALNEASCPNEAKTGKAVLIAPPNKGALLARIWGRYYIPQVLAKDKAGKELIEKENFDYLGQLPSSMKDVLVISGIYGFNPLLSGEHDGSVKHSETCLNTPHKHAKINSGHKMILFNKDTFIHALYFLKN